MNTDTHFYSTTGLTITGNTNLIVSQIASLSCTTDLQVESLTWLLGSEVVSNTVGEQQLVLTFDPVSDSLHNRVYTCRSVTSYGVQERNVTITVQGEYSVSMFTSFWCHACHELASS